MATLSSNVTNILASMYPVRKEMVPCFIGAPGIGKTQGVMQFAKEKGVKVVTYILSCALPSEVSGIRMPDTDTKMLEVFDDARMASLEDGDILFFDEILEAPPALWSACLTLIQDRMLASGRHLPDVMIVAASNPLSNPGIIPASLRDRFQFFELEWDSREWCNYMRQHFHIAGDPNRWSLIVDDIERGLSEPTRFGYNVLTPRRVTKLFEWFLSADGDKRRDIENYAASLFTWTLINSITDILDNSDISVITNAALELNDKFNININDPYDITPRKLYQIIDNLDPELQEQVRQFLEGIEYVQA